MPDFYPYPGCSTPYPGRSRGPLLSVHIGTQPDLGKWAATHPKKVEVLLLSRGASPFGVGASRWVPHPPARTSTLSSRHLSFVVVPRARALRPRWRGARRTDGFRFACQKGVAGAGRRVPGGGWGRWACLPRHGAERPSVAPWGLRRPSDGRCSCTPACGPQGALVVTWSATLA